jgi:hypothetical protein
MGSAAAAAAAAGDQKTSSRADKERGGVGEGTWCWRKGSLDGFDHRAAALLVDLHVHLLAHVHDLGCVVRLAEPMSSCNVLCSICVWCMYTIM